MRGPFYLLLAGFLFTALLFSHAQDSQAPSAADALHAPDGNAREMIMSIFISPLSGAPFEATLETEWTKHLPDGNTTTVVNHRLIVRDGQGRIYQERRALVPKGGDRPSAILRIEISDPVKHTKYFCDSQLTKCELRSYYAPVAETTQAVGPIGDGKRYLSRASLGSETMEGVEVIGTRETISTSAGVLGNDAPIESTKEFWYSPKLGINLQVTRLDPLHGDQKFTVTSLTLSEPDARLFILPPSCKVVDMRERSTQ